MTSPSKRAIIRISIPKKHDTGIDYSLRMYTIIRRYTPDTFSLGVNESIAELTGLRTFFKMTYKEMVESILRDLHTELSIVCTVRIATVTDFERAKKLSRKPRQVSTYKEINSLFLGASFVPKESRVLRSGQSDQKKKIRLTVPFLGKVR